MVKRLTLILLLLAGSARATVVTTAGSGNLSALSFGVNDTIIVANTHTLTVDAANSTTTPIVRMIFVRSGGTLAFSSGMGLMCNAVVLGNRASAPFSSSNGGTLTMAATSYLYLRHDAAFTYDVEPGPNSTVTISVNVTNPANAAQIYMDTPGTYGYGRFYVGNTTASITLSGVRFKHFIRAFGSGGVEFNASGRAATTTTLYKCFFDTSNVAFINVTGHKANQCTFNLPVINNNGAVYIAGGVKDTVWASTITVDANGGAEGDQKGVYINGQDSTVIQGCTIQELNSASFGANSYGILIGGDYAIIKHCTVTGFGFTIATASTADISGLIDSCYGYGTTTTHEWIILHAGDTGWTIRGNDIRFISGGGRSAITFYPSTTPPPHAYIYYNTINAAYGGSPAASAIGFEHTSAGNMTYDGVKMVGNILIGNNTGFNRAEMIFGTTAAQTVTVNFSEFKDNAFDSCYYYGTSSATYPYSRLDSNKHDQTSFGFVDSAAGDFRLDAASPLLNCGDSTYAVSVFGSAQASKAPFDIGYYQTYTTGTCGGAPATPTGACCISYTCYTGYTSAQCTTAGGTYQGDGTTTCASCTIPSGGVGTGYGKRAWATFATLNYGDASYNLPSLAPTVAHYMDISINLSGAMKTAVQALDANIGVVPYHLSATLYPEDTAEWRTYATANGYNFDSGFIWADGATACINPINPTANGICVGNTICTPSGQKITLCGWNTIRLIPNFRYQGMLNFIKSKFHSDASGTGNRGLMNDEATFQWQDTLTHHQTNSAWFPFPGYWSTGSGAQTNAWKNSGLTNDQIADSLIRMRRTGWYKEVIDSFRVLGKQVYMNGAAYGQMTSDIMGDMATIGSGALFGETMNICMGISNTAGSGYGQQAWTLMDSLRIGGRKWQQAGAIIWTNINATDTATLTPIDGALGMKRRLAQERYCWYLMAGTPLRSFLFISLNWGGLGHQNGWSIASDSLFKVCPSMDANLGAPSGARSILSSGTGGTVYQRSFANGKVLWRDGSGGSYTAANAITVSLGATYYPVNYDGSYGAATSTASIRNGEGLVFLTSTAAPTATASIDDVSVTEGGTMTFTVTLSAAQSVVTTLSYSTSDGTATGNTSCTGSYDYVSTIGGKSIPIGSTSTTITIPTCNRASCQASRAFTVTFNVTSPATITVTDPTGVGTIFDDDCGTTYGKTYKGKIVIKGKVKP